MVIERNEIRRYTLLWEIFVYGNASMHGVVFLGFGALVSDILYWGDERGYDRGGIEM